MLPYHTYVPSFGDWGFVLASPYPISIIPFETELPVRYLDAEVVEAMLHFPEDSSRPPGLSANRLDQPVLLDYYLADWEAWSMELVD